MTISLDRPVPVECVSPPSFIIFPIERAHSVWQYFWPFQSIRQFLSTLAESIVVVIGWFLLAPQSMGLGDRIVIAACLVLGVIRMTPCDELPGTITIASTKGPARELIPTLERLILERGYTRDSLPPNSNDIHFRSNWPARHSWLYSPEQDVYLSVIYENIIEIRGPKKILKSF
jgi:hypothetical protein